MGLLGGDFLCILVVYFDVGCIYFEFSCVVYCVEGIHCLVKF